jgi:hypothetical protein
MSDSLNGRARRGVEAKTADYTVVTPTDNGKTFTNTGATGAVTFALPAATVGQWYRFKVKAAQELRIDPNGTQTIALPSTGAQQAAGAYLTANADGEGCEIECVKAGEWEVNYYTGTFTAV